MPEAPPPASIIPTVQTKPSRAEKHPQGVDERGAVGGPGTISIQSIQRKTSNAGIHNKHT